MGYEPSSLISLSFLLCPSVGSTKVFDTLRNSSILLDIMKANKICIIYPIKIAL